MRVSLKILFHIYVFLYVLRLQEISRKGSRALNMNTKKTGFKNFLKIASLYFVTVIVSVQYNTGCISCVNVKWLQTEYYSFHTVLMMLNITSYQY